MTNFVPPCPVQLGPLALQVSKDTLFFTVGNGTQQQIQLDFAATLKLPSPTAGTASARRARWRWTCSRARS